MWSTSSNDMAIYTGYRPKRTNISLTLFADSMREVSILSLLQPLFLSISLIESHPVHPVEKVEKHMKSAPKKMWVHHANTVMFQSWMHFLGTHASEEGPLHERWKIPRVLHIMYPTWTSPHSISAQAGMWNFPFIFLLSHDTKKLLSEKQANLTRNI